MLNKKALASTAGANNPWDVSFAAFEGEVPFKLVSAQSTNPNSIYFKDDGTKMYVNDGGTDTVYQYSLSTAWDLGTASYDSKSFVFSSQDTAPQKAIFKDDGTKVYMLGTTNDTVYQYSLSTAWDVSTISYDSKSFSVATQTGAAPLGLFFKPDGTKMYLTSDTNNSVYQYSLSTAWDVSTASYDSKSFSVAGQEGQAAGVFFKDDGTKMYIIGGATDAIYQYSLSTAWDVSTASYDSKSKSVLAQETVSQALYFKSDGSKVYFVGTGRDTVYQYSLSTAWDISTAAYTAVDGFFIGSQEANTRGIFLKPDGTKMYTVGVTNDTVYQYTLSTAWAIDTASYDSVSISVNAEDTGPSGLFFKNDGTKMYILGGTNDRIYQYSLSTAWDVSTASYDSVSFTIGTQDTAPGALFFKDDGTKMYVAGSINDRIYQYSLSTAWDVSTASYASKSFSVASQTVSPFGLYFKDDGTKMYVLDAGLNDVYQYSLSTAWDVSTASYDSKSFSGISEETDARGLFFKDDGTKMYVAGALGDFVFEYQVG